MLPTSQWKLLPSIQKYDLSSDKKRLAYLFNAYLKPIVEPGLDAMVIWGK